MVVEKLVVQPWADPEGTQNVATHQTAFNS